MTVRWRRLPAIIAAALLLMAPHPSDAYGRGGHAYYRSTDGQMVHRPTRGNMGYGRVAAVCGDGS